jgi:thiol-disulfide isomerase/thioredoxin
MQLSSFLRASTRVLGAALVVATLVTLAACDAPSTRPLVQPGETVEDFPVTTPEGETVGILDVIDGRRALVDVWATWCAPCIAAMPHLQALHNRFGDRGFTVVGVMTDGNATRMGPDYLEGMDVTYPMVFDDGGEAFVDAWGQIAGIPLLVLVDENGTVVDTFRGTTDLDAIDRAVEKLYGVSGEGTTEEASESHGGQGEETGSAT